MPITRLTINKGLIADDSTSNIQFYIKLLHMQYSSLFISCSNFKLANFLTNQIPHFRTRYDSFKKFYLTLIAFQCSYDTFQNRSRNFRKPSLYLQSGDKETLPIELSGDKETLRTTSDRTIEGNGVKLEIRIFERMNSRMC